jgi:hypothetical protein
MMTGRTNSSSLSYPLHTYIFTLNILKKVIGYEYVISELEGESHTKMFGVLPCFLNF